MFKCFMKFAINEARKAFEKNEVPVGCVIVRKSEIIASTHNLMKTNKNSTHHAEILAISKACNVLSSGFLNDCDMYVTLEPCNMCAAAISFARIGRLYIGALDEKFGAVYHNAKLYYTNGLFHIPEHYSGFIANESEMLLKKFFLQKRI